MSSHGAPIIWNGLQSLISEWRWTIYSRATWPGNVETWIPNPALPFNSFVLFPLLLNLSPSNNVDTLRVRGQVNEIMLVKHFAPRKRFQCKHEILLDIIKLQPGQQRPSQRWVLFLIYCLAKLGFFSKAECGRSPVDWCWGLSDKWALSSPFEQCKQIVWPHLIKGSLLY